PVLVGRKDLHGKWARVRSRTLCVAAVGLVCNRVRGRDVREWKAALDKQVILPVPLGSSRLRPAIVHADSITRGDPLNQAVKHLFPVFRLIESEISEVI